MRLDMEVSSNEPPGGRALVGEHLAGAGLVSGATGLVVGGGADLERRRLERVDLVRTLPIERVVDVTFAKGAMGMLLGLLACC
jgi:hypothetical protein